jgi:uncharacterized OB-fold protein
MDGLERRQILATRCAACGRVFVPPQAYCESCFEPMDEWIEAPPEGSVEVHTVVWHGFTGGPTPPYIIAGIRLDGASTLLMHRVVGVDLDDPAGVRAQLPVGARVRAVWAEERSGQILDIAYFAPVGLGQ